MKTIILCLAILFVNGCATSGYSSFYKPIPGVENIDEIELLSKGEEPAVYRSSTFDSDIADLMSKNYFLIGISEFNGSLESDAGAIAQAKKVGASVVLIGSEYAYTKTWTSTEIVQNRETTNYSGSISGNADYRDQYYRNSGSSTSDGRYNGTSTTRSSQHVPVVNQQRRYNQTAFYFVKSTKKWKVGVMYNDLTTEERIKLGRNTGVKITTVIEETPAFNANVLPGDILIAIDDMPVTSKKYIYELWDIALASNQEIELKVIRNKEEKSISFMPG